MEFRFNLIHRRTRQFFLGRLSHLCPKNFSTAPEKTAMITCKITVPDSPDPVFISKIPDFGHFISLDRMNSVFSSNKYKKICFFIFGCWLLPEKISSCPKNNDFARVWGLQPPSPLIHTPVILSSATHYFNII